MPETCDTCDARAYVTLGKVTGQFPDDLTLVLGLCAHHYTVHRAALAAKGWAVITDDRAELLVKP